ncbi:hypothetical protein NQ314_009344 [Rhamnusium bicolor]|uniref:Reverse transcriptase n=1 Tax=Rhamnusium bicolor TaxID=1586634 RepID=A0AAV8Y2G9_9CUCU|nr:hypothetical protein NQ314_009344 [Rhamnusium bicolor]
MLYGAPIWERSMDIARTRQMLASVQRKMALRVSSAYRAVSRDAALVIAGIMPMELMDKERREENDRDQGGRVLASGRYPKKGVGKGSDS